jgi:hypothetical protein
MDISSEMHLPWSSIGRIVVTAIDERGDTNQSQATLSFATVIAQGLDQDTELLNLSATMREKLAMLSAFVGDVNAVQAYKTLQSWPTRVPSSVPQEDFQQAIDEAVAYLKRWMCSVSGARTTLPKLYQS